VISASDDTTVRRWDIETGDPIGNPLTGCDGAVHSVCAGVVNRRKVLVCGGEDGTVRVWAMDSGTEILPPMRGHEGTVGAVVLAKIGKLSMLISGGFDGTIRFWNAATGEPLREPLRAHEQDIRALAYCNVAGAPKVISAGDVGVIRVWDASSANLVVEIRAPDHSMGHFKEVNALACLEIDKRAVLVSGDGVGRLQRWDLSAGTPMSLPIHTEHLFVMAVCSSVLNDQQILVTGGVDGKVQIWNAHTQEALGRPLAGHDKTVLALAAQHSAAGSVVVSGGLDGTVRVWDLDELGEEMPTSLFSQDSDVWSLAVSGSIVAVRSYDRRIRLFDVASRQAIGEIQAGSDGFAQGLAMTEVGNQTMLAFDYRFSDSAKHAVIAACKLGSEPIASVSLGAVSGRAKLVFQKRDGQTLLTAVSSIGEIKTWDTSTRAEIRSLHIDLHRELLDLPEQRVDTFAIGNLRDGRAVAVSGGSRAGLIRVWDLDSGALVVEISVSKEESIWSSALAIAEVDGRALVAAGNSDGTVKLWDAMDRRLIGEQQGETGLHAVQIGFLCGRPVVVSGGADHRLWLWWPDPSIQEAVDLGCPVNAIAFATDDTLVAGTSRGVLAVRFLL
jgi:WD40 repeat protein